MNKRNLPGLIISITGLLILIVFAGGDIFHIGETPGFGRVQLLGSIAGVVIILAGLLLNLLFRLKFFSRNAGVFLLALGAILLFVSIIVDYLGVKTYPKFGIMQIAGVLLGGCVMIFGFMQLRSKNQLEPEQSDKQT